MALSTEGNKIYANIKDLPLINNITDGDEFIVQTPSGTARLDFSNLIINLDNCSFRTTYSDMLSSYLSNSDLIDKIGTEEIIVDNLSANDNSLSAAVTQLNENINAITDSIDLKFEEAKSEINTTIETNNSSINDKLSTQKSKINEIVYKLNEIITFINQAHQQNITNINILP